MREPTAGGIVFRMTPDQRDIEILLIQDSKDRWTIPKGHIEPGESIVDAVDGSKCTGYANVSYEDKYGGIYDIDVYISCANYRTEGYR